MTTADAAVDGREAITNAPSLPPDRAGAGIGVAGASASVQEIARDLAALGALLADRLWQTSALATTAADKVACTDAALTAGRICRLMTGDDDDTRPG